jgi:hypothetical protein
MMAIIDGVTVMGSPEEIKRYKEIADGKKKTPAFMTLENFNNVPEHVKKYSSHPGWQGQGYTNAWY